jgi:hypothetical protein
MEPQGTNPTMPTRLFTAVFALFIVTDAANAAVWHWGCQGQLGQQLVIFDRARIYVLDGKPVPGALQEAIDDKMRKLAESKQPFYIDQNGNEGFDYDKREFIRYGDETKKIVMTETASRRTSHHARLICGRDEIIDTFRKTFRFERTGEPARDITMQCFEYNLSTRGGRPCD